MQPPRHDTQPPRPRATWLHPRTRRGPWSDKHPARTSPARLRVHLHLVPHPPPPTNNPPAPTSAHLPPPPPVATSQVVSVADCELRPDEAIRDTWRVRDLGFNAVILGTRACRECNAFLLPPQLAAPASPGSLWLSRLLAPGSRLVAPQRTRDATPSRPGPRSGRLWCGRECLTKKPPIRWRPCPTQARRS